MNTNTYGHSEDCELGRHKCDFCQFESKEEVVDHLRARMDSQGVWQVIAVGRSETRPSFCYSVGFPRFLERPEVMIFGLHPADGQLIINAVGHALKNEHSHTRFKDRDLIDIGGQFPLKLCRTLPGTTEANLAYRILGPDTEVWVLVWPDKEGRYPGDEGCDELCDALQTADLPSRSLSGTF